MGSDILNIHGPSNSFIHVVTGLKLKAHLIVTVLDLKKIHEPPSNNIQKKLQNILGYSSKIEKSRILIFLEINGSK